MATLAGGDAGLVLLITGIVTSESLTRVLLPTAPAMGF